MELNSIGSDSNKRLAAVPQSSTGGGGGGGNLNVAEQQLGCLF